MKIIFAAVLRFSNSEKKHFADIVLVIFMEKINEQSKFCAKKVLNNFRVFKLSSGFNWQWKIPVDNSIIVIVLNTWILRKSWVLFDFDGQSIPPDVLLVEFTSAAASRSSLVAFPPPPSSVNIKKVSSCSHCYKKILCFLYTRILVKLIT